MIEVVLGLALLSILVGGIFSVLRGTMTVSKDIVEGETQTLKVHSFCELLRRNFEQMPGNARVHLKNYTGGSDMLEVSFTDYPLAFTWPGVQAGAKTVLFRTERASVGGLGLQAAILYLDEEQSENWRKGKFDETKGLGRITIMGGIANLRWRFFNDQNQEYEEEWPLTKTQRPTFVEMSLTLMDGSDQASLVFWIPTMANPTQFTNFGNQTGAGGVPRGGVPGGRPSGAGPGGGLPGGGLPGGGLPGGGLPGGGGGRGGPGGGGRGAR